MLETTLRILFVEDDRAVRITVRDLLSDAGHAVTTCPDGTSALAAAAGALFDLLLTDIRLPGIDGITLFRRVRRIQPDCAAILITAYGNVEDAVAVIREGAQDYLTKPFPNAKLLLLIERAAGDIARRRRLAQVDGGGEERLLVGASPAMTKVINRLDAAAEAGVNVLIRGETGTGKELCAQALHQGGSRAKRPMVQVNCAAIPQELFEAEMFGHEKGSFTGAVQRRQGRVAAADKGTLFLDEVGELSLEHQSKLLRFIDTGTFEPVGSSQTQHADVCVLSATNVDLSAEVEGEHFRRDLFFRLNVVEIKLPPLRERRSDIPLLVSHFLQQIAARRNAAVPFLSPAAMAALFTYDYPGNVRELLHALEHGVALARESAIDSIHLPRTFTMHSSGLIKGFREATTLADAVKVFERLYIDRVLHEVDGRRAEAASLLGISRKSLWRKLKGDEPTG